MSDFEEKLIKSVKHHSCLYNKADFGFRNRFKRDKAWTNVSAACGLPAKQCQCRWKTLRDRYVREYHKGQAIMHDLEDVVQWRYFEELSFLKEHIKPRGINEDSQLDFEVLPVAFGGELSSNSNEETNLSDAAESLDARQTEFAFKGKSGDYGYDGPREEDGNWNDTAEPPMAQTYDYDRAQGEFVRVMELLEQVVKKKLLEEKDAQLDPLSVAQTGGQDPFYKYLESILNRVDETTRADIQLKLLNFANEQVKSANTN